MNFQTNQPPLNTKKCKHCGMDIPEQAKVCPYCNKKQSHTVRNVILIIVGIVILLILLFSCMSSGNRNSSNSNSSVGTTTQTDNSSNSNSSDNSSQGTVVQPEQTQQDYTVGSTFTSNDVSATLNSVTTSTGTQFDTLTQGNIYLVLNWTVTNNSSDEFNPFDFSTSGYVDGSTVQNAITGIPDQFDMGTMIIPGSSTTGNVIYEVPQNWSEFQIRVQIGTIGGDSAIFKVTPNQVS